MSQPLLEVHDLVMHFPVGGGMFSKPAGVVRAVDGVSFNVRKGETLGLVGESGCGKTTTGRCILQLERPTGGRIVFEGIDMVTLDAAQLRAVRRRVQVIFQDPYSSLNPRMTVGQILAEPLKVHGVLAAAALIALEEGPKRLHIDHENAQLLARGLARIPGIKVRPENVQTNIVIFDVGATGVSSSDFLQRLADRKVLGGSVDARRIRMVTHVDVNRTDIETALRIIAEVIGKGL